MKGNRAEQSKRLNLLCRYMAMTTDEQRRVRHRDAMRRVDVMNEVLRGVSDDYRRMNEIVLSAIADDLRSE